MQWASGVNASSRLGGRTTEWGGCGRETPHTQPLSLVRWEGSGEGAVPLPKKSFVL